LNDLTSWVGVSVGKTIPKPILEELVGADYVDPILDTPSKYALFSGLIDSLSLLSRRRIGALNDGAQFPKHTGYPYERITLPTLVLFGSEDHQIPWAEQRYLIETLPHANLKEIDGGTHFMILSHSDILGAMIRTFLEDNAPTVENP
jgi:pimeloyl-ACP methyl ester carboxylesterase